MPMGTHDSPTLRSSALRLFALSFVALFLELLVIRWSPAVVRLVAYYANLMLISSFLGLGIGAMLALRTRRWIGFFPLLLAFDIGLLHGARSLTLPGSTSEFRFFLHDAPELLNYAVLVVLFLANAAVFVPLGQEIGRLFHALPTLRAYTWDLGGSLAGSVAFGLFSFHVFSPPVGMAAVMLLYLALVPKRTWLWALPLFALTFVSIVPLHDRETIWSPYYHIQYSLVESSEAAQRRRGAPSDERDVSVSGLVDEAPPLWVVSVNQDFYQLHGSIDLSRYPDDAPTRERIANLEDQYLLRHAIRPGAKRVLVLGSGGGMDVEGALLSGAEHVDAVEIDPELVALSRRINPAAPYDDPRVTVHVDDARAFLQRTTERYDLVAFGLLDSQALFSSMSNLRLDGFTYTVESFGAAWRLVDDDGLLAITFAAGRSWLAPKLIRMVEAATGQRPIVYGAGAYLLLAVPRFDATQLPASFGVFDLMPREEQLAEVPVATDDWPFLYLSERTIPRDYVIVILSLLVVSCLAVLGLRGGGFGLEDGHFLFMGLGFLLLQTKSIGDAALYLGSTWLVTMLVVSGVLVMVLMANFLAMRLSFSLKLYLPLLLSLLLIYLVPRDFVLGFPFAGRMTWVALILPLPIFFAGLVFSTTFRLAKVPSALFGANLVGAMIGGFCEYLGMAFGTRHLMLIVVAAYLASWACRVKLARGAPA